VPGACWPSFIPDLADAGYVTPFAIFHQRYATNVLPSWDPRSAPRAPWPTTGRSTPSGATGRAWMPGRPRFPRNVIPILTKDGSDSTSLDEVVELLARNGRSVAEAVRMLLPPAGRQRDSAFLHYHADWRRALDGPAGISVADGNLVGVALDRNGLRPCRFSSPKTRWSSPDRKLAWWTLIRRESPQRPPRSGRRCWWPTWVRTSCSKTSNCSKSSTNSPPITSWWRTPPGASPIRLRRWRI